MFFCLFIFLQCFLLSVMTAPLMTTVNVRIIRFCDFFLNVFIVYIMHMRMLIFYLYNRLILINVSLHVSLCT